MSEEGDMTIEEFCDMHGACDEGMILSGLLNRYELMSRGSHPGWHESRGKHEDAIGRVRGRIMDVIASNYEEESNLPDVLHVTHGHRIYRVDFIEGRFDLIGTLTVDLTTTITPAIEVN